MTRIVFGLVVVFPFLLGCTHHQLRFNAVGHARTVSDIQTQQVLDNLAKFVANPHALPHFEYPNQGASGVTDDLTGSASIGSNQAVTRTLWSLGLGGRRTSNGSFTMTPLNDPRKLELMRCVYQHAVRGCCSCPGDSLNCPKCEARFNSFYLGSTNPSMIKQSTQDGRPIVIYVPEVDENGNPVQYDSTQNPIGTVVIANMNQLNEVFYTDANTGEVIVSAEDAKKDAVKKHLKRRYESDSIAAYTERNGTITTHCLTPECCWFKSGSRAAIPKNCRSCGMVGNYCGTYVWVPECGQDQLTKLTLTILDIALNDSSSKKATKEVVAYLDADENFTSKENATFRVTGTVPALSKAKDLVPDSKKAVATVQKLNSEQTVAKENVSRLSKGLAQRRVEFENLLEQGSNPDLLSKEIGGSFGKWEMAEKINGIIEFDRKKLPDNRQSQLAELAQKAMAIRNAEAELDVARNKERVLDELLRNVNAGANTPDLGPTSTLYESSPSLQPQGSNILQFDQQLRTLGPQ